MNNIKLSLFIGRTLREMRESKNIKQEWVAEKIGCTKSNYSKIEAGKIKRIDVVQLDQICKLYNFNAFHILLYAAIQDFNYKINTFEEFFDSLNYLPINEKEKMLTLAIQVMSTQPIIKA